jgi:Secretion system C-terminal sorting domain
MKTILLTLFVALAGMASAQTGPKPDSLKRDSVVTGLAPKDVAGFYPNPFTDHVHIDATFDMMDVIDTKGRIVLTSKNTREVSVASLPSGIYYFTYVIAGKLVHQKMIKRE